MVDWLSIPIIVYECQWSWKHMELRRCSARERPTSSPSYTVCSVVGPRKYHRDFCSVLFTYRTADVPIPPSNLDPSQ